MFDYAALERRVAALEAKSSASLRFGRVTGVEGGQARVEIPDGDNVVSHTMPTVQRRVLKDQEIKMPDIGEPVAVLCSGQSEGQEDAIVLGAVYSPTATDPGQAPHMEYSQFSDGTIISYDREAHKLFVSVQGEIEVYAKGDVKFTCDANVTAKVKGNVTAEVDGNLECTTKGHTRLKALGEAKVESAIGITLKAPFIKICGYLTVTDMDGKPGEGVLRGTYTLRDGSFHVPDEDVTAGVVSVRKHVHEHSGGSGLSGKPAGG